MEQILDSKSVLQKYWGYKSFQSRQKEIIDSILSGKDTVAILATGAGKSLCYQVPALCIPGVAIVVSPLIALMQDQVQRLKTLKIKAEAIHSGLHKREIDIILDNAAYGELKLLYISPERLNSELFQQRMAKMKVSFVAIDESHCISQWGHDFRPSYLNIHQIRESHSDIALLALTATATTAVLEDIKSHLKLDTPQVFTDKFERNNLSINFIQTDKKHQILQLLLSKVTGTGIIYVRHRKTAFELFQLLESTHSCEFYHAGLTSKEREAKQQDWLSGNKDIMIATSAFGMGIDKNDVRFVIHYGLPPSIEEYYQEIGRAGRDHKESETYLLFSANDMQRLLNQIESKYSPLDLIREAYGRLYNYFEIPVGQGEFQNRTFDIRQFSTYLGASVSTTYQLIRHLETEGLIAISNGIKRPAKVKFNCKKELLFDLGHPHKDVSMYMLRNYENILHAFAKINIDKIAYELELQADEVHHVLIKLSQLNVLDYNAVSEKPYITFLTNRFSKQNLKLNEHQYAQRKTSELKRVNELIKLLNTSDCRMHGVVNYFKAQEYTACGKCDNCLKEKDGKSEGDYKLKLSLKQEMIYPIHLDALMLKHPPYKWSKVSNLLHELIANNEVSLNNKMLSKK